MKTIKASLNELEGFLNKGSKSQLSCMECLPDAIDEFDLRSYFSTVTNHNSDVNLQMERNAFYVFTTFKVNIRLVNEVAITVNSEISYSESIFDLPGEYYKDGELDAIRFVAQYDGVDRRLGYFIVPKKTLVLCDITHDRSGFDLLSQIMNYLIDNNHIVKKKIKKKVKSLNYDFSRMTFGADPEFEYVNFNKAVSYKEHNATNITHSTSSSAEIGVDGCGHQVELRPKPSATVEGVMTNITELFSKIKDSHLSTIGNAFAIGGHIHFGLGQHIQMTDSLLHLLDYFIGKKSLFLNGSARGSYGKLSSYEGKSYGFEYRTPSAAIFTNPKIFEITLKIARDIIVGYLKQTEFILNSDIVVKDDLEKYTTLDVEEIFYYLEFFDTFKQSVKYSDNVVSYWVEGVKIQKVKEVKKTTNIDILFNDVWDSDVSIRVRTDITKMRGVKNKGNVRVCFFGLKEDRGAVVSGLNVTGYNLLDAMGSGTGDLIIGLPYSFRKYGNDYKKIIKAIKVRIKEYFNSRDI